MHIRSDLWPNISPLMYNGALKLYPKETVAQILDMHTKVLNKSLFNQKTLDPTVPFSIGHLVNSEFTREMYEAFMLYVHKRNMMSTYYCAPPIPVGIGPDDSRMLKNLELINANYINIE